MYHYNFKYQDIADELNVARSTVEAVAAGNVSKRIREAIARRCHCEVSDLWPDKNASQDQA